MKIRCDFVTNSSSSSFVAMKVSGGLLEDYLKNNQLEGIFDSICDLWDEYEPIEAELTRSFSASLILVLEDVIEKLREDPDKAKRFGYDELAIEKLIQFLKLNKDTIDKEVEGCIDIKFSNSEDGYGYAQSLIYKNHHGKLTKWPCCDGWNIQSGGGYYKIQEFNSKLFNGEIRELADLAYETIWNLIWDDKALSTAIDRTGIIDSFDVSSLNSMKIGNSPIQTIMDSGSDYWRKVLTWGNERQLLSESEKMILQKIIDGEKDESILSIKQAKMVIRMRDRLVSKGMPIEL